MTPEHWFWLYASGVPVTVAAMTAYSSYEEGKNPSGDRILSGGFLGPLLGFSLFWFLVVPLMAGYGIGQGWLALFSHLGKRKRERQLAAAEEGRAMEAAFREVQDEIEAALSPRPAKLELVKEEES